MLDATTGQAEGNCHTKVRPRVRLQRVVLDRPASLRNLYWRARSEGQHVRGAVRLETGGALRVEPGATVTFGTCFGANHQRVRPSISRSTQNGNGELLAAA